MKVIRPSCYEEFVSWYLEREFRKGSDSFSADKMKTIESIVNHMQTNHSGKIREWFPSGKWDIVEIDTVDEPDYFVCLDGGWTKECQLMNSSATNNYRLLKVFVENARTQNYFEKSETDLNADEYNKRQKYFGKLIFETILPDLRGEDRIVLCSLSNDEKNKNTSGTYYLHDGLGRLLTYNYLMKYHGKKLCRPIEAFLALENMNPITTGSTPTGNKAGLGLH